MGNYRAWIFISTGENSASGHRCLGLIWNFEIRLMTFWERWGKSLGLKSLCRWAVQLNYEMKENQWKFTAKQKMKWKNERGLKFVLCYNLLKILLKRKNHVGGNFSQMMRIISYEREKISIDYCLFFKNNFPDFQHYL